MGSDGRGVDNSVDGWATDYLLFCAMFMFACRLFFLKHCSAESALTQLFQSGGYLFGALGHHVFPNRAFDSPCGDHYFYWVWIAAYTCQGLSCICWLKWADRFLHFNKGAWRWTRIPMALCLGIAVVSVGTIDFGSAWCLSQPEAALVDTSKYLFFSYDAVEQLTGTSAVEQGGVRHQPASERFDLCTGKQPLCDAVVQYAEALFYLAWGSAWLLVACRVGIFLHDHYERVFAPGTARVFEGMWMNFNVSASTLYYVLQFLNFWAPFALFAYGPYLILYVVGFAMAVDMDPSKLYSDLHVGVVYHMGVISCHICTYYISQNVEHISEKLDVMEEASKKKK
jgi:hypothetical protein